MKIYKIFFLLRLQEISTLNFIFMVLYHKLGIHGNDDKLDHDEPEENESRTNKRKRNQSESNSDDDTSVTADIDFESYIYGLKEKILPKEFFVKIMKDLTTNDLKKTEKLNSILLKEWMQSIEENHKLKAENERLQKLNEAMDVSKDHMFQHENIEIKQEQENAE